MALFSDFFAAVKQAQMSNGDLREKLETIAPVAKQEGENIKKVSGQLNDVYKDLREAVNAPDFNAASTSVKSASDKWDNYFEEYYEQLVIKNNPQKYSGYPNLSAEQQEEFTKEVEATRSGFESQVRDIVGDNAFELGSKIKNQADDVLSSIGDFCNKIEKDAGKITKGINKVIETTEKLAGQGQKIFGQIFHNNIGDSASQSVWLHNLQNIGISRLGMAATAVGGVATGVGSMVAAFKTGDIKGALNAGKNSISNIRSTWNTANSQRGDFFNDKADIQNSISGGRHVALHKSSTSSNTTTTQDESSVDSEIDTTTSTSSQENPKGSKSDNTNEGGAEYVSEINFVLDGTPGEANSECTIDGVSYLISNYQLSQSMLSPMTLTFTLVKKAVAEESEKDVKYNVCKEIIGLDVDLTVKTKSSETNADASTFKFKGLITGVSASRGMGGTPSIFVTASSYDYILNAAPNCRSFENKTLEEIVSTVTSSCSKLECSINPRLKTPIPYIVQYNQTDYEFLTSLARRFGEWMYHDGTKFIFGEIVQPSEAVVKMRYPGGSIFGHGVDLQLRDLNIMHVSPDLYNYGENGIKSQTDDGMADRNMHELNEAVWNRVKSLYTQQDIYYPHIGGAFDDGQSEGSIELIENSIKVESRGKKAQMFTSNGASKVAKLFLGQQFEIEDGIEKTSSIDKQDLLQHPLMVLSVSHTFNSDQTYDNTFEAIPITCDYPPYGNADIFATAFPQRATIIDNQDPQGLGRVRVQFPWQKVQSTDDNQMITPWIRVSQPYGGFSKGTQFISEVGEEVMIGFEMDNIERPYVLGALFNGTGNPDPEWKAQVAEGTANNIKAIRTRNGHTIQFNDEGDGGDIQIYDYEKNNYLIHLSSDGKYIRIEAKGDIQISAGNNIGIKAGKNISIEAGENISMDSGKDTDINADANMSISAENNMQQEATDIFVKAKDAISQESENSHIIKTTTLQEKSSGKTSIDGGGLVEITASSVKVR